MYTLFCPECYSYLLPFEDECVCGAGIVPKIRRPNNDSWVSPGIIGGPSRGTPLIIDDKVVFSWSDRRSAGGVTALDRHTGHKIWSTDDWDEDIGQIEMGVSRIGDMIVWGTRGRLPLQKCSLYIVDKSGDLDHCVELPGGVWATPVRKDRSVIVVTGDGTLLELDSAAFTVSRKYPLGKTGWFYVSVLHNSIFIFLRQTPLFWNWELPDEYPSLFELPKSAEIISEPVVGLNEIFVPTNGGLLEISHGVPPKCIPTGSTRLNRPPIFANSKLLFANNDEKLVVIDPKNIEKTIAAVKDDRRKSFLCRPEYGRGLIASVSRDRFLFVFRGDNGELFRRFELQTKSDAVGAQRASIGFGDHYWYMGDWEGNAYAIPWHLGKYKWAAEYLYQRRLFFEAGVYYAVAAQFTPELQQRDQLYRYAETCWDEEGRPELAARMWKKLARQRDAASAYCRAAEVWRGKNNQEAAEFYFMASRLLWHLGGDSEEADRCSKQAAALGQWPIIQLSEWNIPKMVQGELGRISFRAENIGYGQAENLYFTLGGSLIEPINCRVVDPLQRGKYFEITLEIAPTKASDELNIVVEYSAVTKRRMPFSSTLSTTIDASPAPHIIKVGDSVWGKLKIVNLNNEPVEIEIGDRIGTEVEIELG